MHDTSRTVKRLRALLIDEAKQRKPLLIRLLPILTARIVILNQPTKILTDLRQISVFQNSSEIVAKPNGRYIQRLDVPAKDHRGPTILVRLNGYVPACFRKIVLGDIDLHPRTTVHRHRVVRKGLRDSRVRCGH